MKIPFILSNIISNSLNLICSCCLTNENHYIDEYYGNKLIRNDIGRFSRYNFIEILNNLCLINDSFINFELIFNTIFQILNDFPNLNLENSSLKEFPFDILKISLNLLINSCSKNELHSYLIISINNNIQILENLSEKLFLNLDPINLISINYLTLLFIIKKSLKDLKNNIFERLLSKFKNSKEMNEIMKNSYIENNKNTLISSGSIPILKDLLLTFKTN